MQFPESVAALTEALTAPVDAVEKLFFRTVSVIKNARPHRAFLFSAFSLFQFHASR
jgi:hypothetical protein